MLSAELSTLGKACQRDSVIKALRDGAIAERSQVFQRDSSEQAGAVPVDRPAGALSGSDTNRRLAIRNRIERG